MKKIKDYVSAVMLLVGVSCWSSGQQLIEIPNVNSAVKVAKSINGGPSGLSSGDNLGRSIANIGDINNDGIEDLAVGAHLDNTGGTDRGAVYVCFMNTDGTVKSSPAPVKICHGTSIVSPSGSLSLANSDFFGVSIAGIGDLNHDSYEDIVVGAYGTTAQGNLCGAIYVFLLDSLANVLSYKQITYGSPGFVNLPNNAQFGMSVANAGDLNNDGENDIVVGAPGMDSTAGGAWIIRLKTNGQVKNYMRIEENTNGFPNFSTDSGDNLGYSVAGSGDLNYDGVRDVILGIPGDDDGYTNSGGFWVLYLDTTSAVISNKKLSYPLTSKHYYPDNSDVGLGESLTTADINEDGIMDILAGVKKFSASKGGFYFMVLDSSQNIESIKMTGFQYGWTTVSPTTPPQFGVSLTEVHLAGNLYHKQFAVGANLHNQTASDEGSFYVLTMDSLTYDFPAGMVVDYSAITDFSGDFTATLANTDAFGIDGAVIGDLNNDGINDMVVGAPGDDSNSKTNSGAVYVLFMKDDGRVDSYQKIADNTGGLGNLTAGDQFGNGVAPAGDFNGDGIEDILVGAPADGANDRGVVYLLYMNTNGTVKTSPAPVRIEHPDAINGDAFGMDVDTLGDLDNDGVNDLVVGTTKNDDGGTSGSDRGAVYIVFMNSNGTVKGNQRISDTQGGFGGDFSNSGFFGIGVDGIGDFNQDGAEDIVVGANINATGAVFVIYLDTTGMVVGYKKINNAASNFPDSLQRTAQFGNSVQMVPDIDGNSVNDLLISNQQYASYGLNRGAVWIALLDSVANVIDTRLITDSCGRLYTNMNPIFAFGSCVRYYGLDSLGNVRVLVGTRDDGGGSDRGGALVMTIHRFHSASYSQLQPYYAELDKKLDGEDYVFFDHRVHFRYYDKYHDDDDKLSFKIYNAIGDIVYSDVTALTTAIPDPNYGENRFSIECGTATPNLPYGVYILEVINSKRESYFLRFQLSNSSVSLKR